MHHSTSETNHYICVLSITVNTKKCFQEFQKRYFMEIYDNVFKKSRDIRSMMNSLCRAKNWE